MWERGSGRGSGGSERSEQREATGEGRRGEDSMRFKGVYGAGIAGGARATD